MSNLIETTAADRPEHNHLWGREEWIVNNDAYCGKLLWIKKGFQSSIHFHPVKRETFLILVGILWLEVWETPEEVETTKPPHRILLRGWARDAVEIPPGTPHRFIGDIEDALVVEFSTTHSDEDVVRLQESGRVEVSDVSL